MVEMVDDLLESDQRLAVPGIGGRMVDGDERGVAVLFHGQLVGQVEDASLVGLYGSAHGRILVAVLGSADRRRSTSHLFRVLQCSEVAAFRAVTKPARCAWAGPVRTVVLSL